MSASSESSLCTAVLSAGPGVCSVCKGPASPTSPRCFCCARVGWALGCVLAPVVPISTYRIPGRLHTVLRGYKDASVSDARRHFAARATGLLDGFLRRHLACLEISAGGRLELTVAVPPSHRRGDPPLHALIGPEWSRGLLVRGVGTLGHLRPSAEGFDVASPFRPVVRGSRVLLVDDTLTTGARLQSAALALRERGAASVVAVAVGRVVRPELSDVHAAYWRRARSEAFRPDRCCLPGCRATRGQEPLRADRAATVSPDRARAGRSPCDRL